MKYIFVDTMIFLHFVSIEEINFFDLFDAEKICIVIPRITLRELDDKKNTHKQHKIKERAKKVLLKIESWIENNAPLKNGVQVEYYRNLPTINFEASGLNPAWNDDYLLATIVQYMHDDPNADTVLITQDSGPRLTAKHLGINSFQLPSGYILPVTLDPIEKENLELKRSISKLRSSLPKISVYFVGDPPSTYSEFYILPPPDPIEHIIEPKLLVLKEKFPKEKPIFIPKNGRFENQIATFLSATQPTNEEIERYNKDVDLYIKACEEYMRNPWHLESLKNRSIEFQIEIKNEGTAPADDVSVNFHFPDGFKLLETTNFPKPLNEPTPPEKPKNKLELFSNPLGVIRPIDRLYPTISDITPPITFKIEKTKSYNITDHFNRIKQGESAILPKLTIIFDSYNTANSFSCDYSIQPVNLPEPIKGELNFVINKKTCVFR